jgi:antitoxin component of RelBE/YafQ-DinJ toxin-antitoxin module
MKDKLASFRVDEALWNDFQAIAKSNDMTATAALISFIRQVVNAGQIDISSGAKKNQSLREIDKRIDDKVAQCIDTIILESIQEGHIKEAITESCKAPIQRLDELFNEVEDLKKQLEELRILSSFQLSGKDECLSLISDLASELLGRKVSIK